MISEERKLTTVRHTFSCKMRGLLYSTKQSSIIFKGLCLFASKRRCKPSSHLQHKRRKKDIKFIETENTHAWQSKLLN